MTKAGNIVTETVDLDRLYQIAQGEQKANSPEKRADQAEYAKRAEPGAVSMRYGKV